MTPRPPREPAEGSKHERPNPHDVARQAAVARALETEREIERTEDLARAQAQRALRTAAVVGLAALFCLTYLVLLYGQLAAFNSANVFTTLALNFGLWLVSAFGTRAARRPR